jgi:tetratricopeptide (TPR) repeat protein
LNPSAPPALEAVCRKAMARDPADRYPSAEEVATEVRRWLADEPVAAYSDPWPARAARWARRRKTAVVAAAVLLLTTAVASTAAAGLIWREQRQTRREWKRAEAEHAEAARNAEAAVEVVRNLSTYVDSYETGSGNTGVNSMQLRKDRLDAALASYERLLGLHPEDPDVRANVARMHRMRAHLSQFLGKTADAEGSYGQAIRLFERLAADFPGKLEYQELRALNLHNFSQYLQRLGRDREAAEMADGSIRLFEDLRRARPDQPSVARVLANLFVARSDRELQVGRWADSEQSARRSAGLYAELAETPGTRPEPLDPLFHAMAEHNLALALREQGRTDEALAAHDRAAERIAGLTKVTNSRDAWSFNHRVRTERAWTQGRLPGRAAAAVADLEAAIRGWDALLGKLGDVPVDLERKGVAGLYCGRLKALLGRREEAARDLSAAAAVLEKLVAGQPKIPAYRYDLGRVYTALGQTAGDPAEAAGWYRKAREMLDAASRQYPESAPFRQALTELDALTSAR